MCLIVKKAAIAKEPVKCYKVMVEAFDIDSGEYVMTVTPFRHTRIDKDVLKGDGVFKAEDSDNARKWNCKDGQLVSEYGLVSDYGNSREPERHNTLYVKEGFVHLYLSESALLNEKYFYKRYENTVQFIDDEKGRCGCYKVKFTAYLCEIPENTLYCEGENLGMAEAGCAREIRFLKRLNADWTDWTEITE